MRTLEERIMDAARQPDTKCVRCGSTGTTRGCHYNGQRQHTYGKGRSIKCHPLMTAEFCMICDALFQEGSVSKDDGPMRDTYSEDFLHWIAMTNISRVARGIFG